MYDGMYCGPGSLKEEIATDLTHCHGLIEDNVIYRLLLVDQPEVKQMRMSELAKLFPDLKYLSIRRTNLSEIIAPENEIIISMDSQFLA